MNAQSQAQITSLSLLQRVRDDDQQAWEQLVTLYYPLVYRWCRDAGLQDQDVLDIVQEVFKAVASNLSQFRRDEPGQSFRKWLRGITRHKLGDHWRKNQAKHSELPPSLRDNACQDVSQESEFGGVVKRALAIIEHEFEERTWKAAWRVLVVCDPVKEVALSLGMSTNAVYKAKSRVICRVREQFADFIENE